MWEDEKDAGGGSMDELLAVLGYKVKSSDMVDVAHKLEQLEMVMGSAQEDGISHLSDTVYYNPSDLFGWVQSMLSELNSSSTFDFDNHQIQDPSIETASSVVYSNDKQHIIRNQSRVYNDDSEYDLRAIPGVTAYPQDDSGSETSRKRMKTSIGSGSGSTSVGAV